MRIVACSLLLAIFPGCFVERGRPQPPIVTTSQVKGTVIGPDGALVPGAVVELSAPTEAGDAWRKIADVQTNSDGTYVLSTRHVGAHRIVARAEGLVDAATDFVLPQEVKEQVCDFALASAAIDSIDGILLTPDGLPLSAVDLAFLFPKLASHDETQPSAGEDGVTEYFPFTGGSGLFARFPHDGVPPDGPLEADIDANSARFRIAVPAPFDGRIALDFRGAERISRNWRSGDGVVEFEVDVETLRKSLGTLELTALEPTSFQNLVVVLDDVSPDVSSFVLAEATPPLRLIGVPVGRFSVVGKCADGRVVQSLDVLAEGEKKPVSIAPTAPARLVIEVADARYSPYPLAPESIELRNPHGAPLPFQVSIESRPNRTATVVIDGVPAGRAVLFVAGSFQVIDLIAGEVQSLAMKLENPATCDIDARAFGQFLGNVPPTMRVRMRLTTQDDVLVMDTRFDAPFRKDGWVRTTLNAPPGDYRLVLELGSFRVIDEKLSHSATAGITHLYPIEP